VFLSSAVTFQAKIRYSISYTVQAIYMGPLVRI
jgi:hypothetical protein